MVNQPIAGIGLCLGLMIGGLMGCAAATPPSGENPSAESTASPAQDPPETSVGADADDSGAETVAQAKPTAEVLAAEATGEPNNYSFSVTIRSPDTGCDQYANWWEVLDESGQLLYRRILLHSHINEQPFTRSGGPVAVAADQTVIIRGHMDPSGYGNQALRGTVAEGFQSITLAPDFAPSVAGEAPQPTGCTF